MIRNNFLLVLVFLSILLLINCKNENQSDNKPRTVKTLQVWIMPNTNNPEKDFLELIKPFLDNNPDINVKIKVLAWDTAWDKISLSVTSGEAPDITQLGTTWVAAIASNNRLVDLTGKYDETKFIPQTLSTTFIESDPKKIRYAIPWMVDTRVLYYRKDACEKAKVNPDVDFKTWGSFKKALKKLNNSEINGKKIPAFGICGKKNWDIVHNFSWWIWSFGGNILSDDNRKCVINSDKSFNGIKAYTEMVNDKVISIEALEKNSAENKDLFKNNEFCVAILQPYSDVDDRPDIGTAVLPEGPAGKSGFLGGSTLAVYKSSKNIDEAIMLINFLTSKDTQIQYFKKFGVLPSVSTAYEDEIFTMNNKRKIYKQQIMNSRAYPSISEWGPIENKLLTGFTDVWDVVLQNANGKYNDEAVKKELAEIAKNIDGYLQSK